MLLKARISSILLLLAIIFFFEFFFIHHLLFIYTSLISFIGFIIFRIIKDRFNTFFTYFLFTLVFTYSIIPSVFFTFSSSLLNTKFGDKSLLSIQSVLISLIPMIIISFFYRWLDFNSKRIRFSFITTSNFNLALFSFILLQLLVEVFNNAYYSKGMVGNDNVNYIFLNKFSFLLLLKPFSFVGVVLQIIRLKYTRRKVDLYILVLMNIVVILCYLPSGSRESTFIMLFATILFYIRFFYSRLRVNVLKSFIGFFTFLMLVSVIGIWRVSSVHKFESETFYERIQILFKLYEFRDDLNEIIETNSPLERFNEFNQIGDLIVYKTDNHIPPVFFNNLEYYFLSFIPSFLRPVDFDFNDGAQTMFKYNLDEGVGGSVPITIHGDMYHRFGYFGFLGLFLVILPYILVDMISFNKGYIGIIFSAIFFFQVIRLDTQSLLKHLIVLSRDVLFTYLLATIIFIIILKYAKKESISN